ncbi:unnamed protein product [Oppiella nova]|uniref:BRCT domain-containing protein n=1 Tax=Oppiella nova TaxID=334625 RepID=A0A7R9M6R0_9ACAR|nr:unnamed protein product [Oppiella nova]CAG2171677.1 unnamed protein product [Oppiella nova]
MSEISGKRRRSECQMNGTNVFFIRDGIHRKRMTILERNAQTLGLVVSDHFRESIDYIISDFEYEEQVMESIGCDIRELKAVVVNTRWLTDSMQSQQLMPFNTNYRLKRRHKGIDSKTSNECTKESSNGDYICQRMSSLNHQNSKLSEPLEVMAKEAKLRAHLFDTVRYLGFKKAAAVLKSLPFAVKHVDEVSCLKDIGKHSKKIIQEILDEGVSREVDTIRNSDWFKTMTLFTNIYGIGPKTAQKWYDLGLRSLDDVINTTSVLKNQIAAKSVDMTSTF